MMLTAKQRQFLRGLAHPLEPVIRVGKGGVSTSVVAETRKALQAHELIKVRLDADDRKPLVETLAAETGAEVAGIIGKTAILFRQRDEDPGIKLPSGK